jgi:predicted phosphodiesterase
MRAHGVQIFFYGHDHVFVDDVVDDIHYALPGSFGAPWHFGAQVTGYNRFWSDSGHARLSVSRDEARVEYINQAGAVFHTFSVKPR